jgi:hypothetical protein
VVKSGIKDTSAEKTIEMILLWTKVSNDTFLQFSIFSLWTLHS